MITVGHFFAGAGGGILAAEILGHRSVFALEIDEWRCRVIEESGWFPSIHVECADIRTFDPTPWKGRMDCIAAGFPCQDISCAGKGEGIRGKRSGLIWELFRAIDVIRPSIIFLENSPAIRKRGRREIIAALLERGYSWRDGTLAASHVGAGHKRNRWWCLAADADGKRKLEQERRVAYERGWIGDGVKENSDFTVFRCGQLRTERNVLYELLEYRSNISSASHLDEIGRGGRSRKITETPGWIEFTDRLERAFELGGLTREDAETIAIAGAYTEAIHWSPPDAGVCRVVDGMADRMDRNKKRRISACGDGQVPLQAAVAWGILAWS